MLQRLETQLCSRNKLRNFKIERPHYGNSAHIKCESKGDTGNKGDGNHSTIRQDLSNIREKREIKELQKTCEITLHLAQIVNTQQLQRSVLQKHGLFQVCN
jgi:hypothetical protein